MEILKKDIENEKEKLEKISGLSKEIREKAEKKFESDILEMLENEEKNHKKNKKLKIDNIEYTKDDSMYGQSKEKGNLIEHPFDNIKKYEKNKKNRNKDSNNSISSLSDEFKNKIINNLKDDDKGIILEEIPNDKNNNKKEKENKINDSDKSIIIIYDKKCENKTKIINFKRGEKSILSKEMMEILNKDKEDDECIKPSKKPNLSVNDLISGENEKNINKDKECKEVNYNITLAYIPDSPIGNITCLNETLNSNKTIEKSKKRNNFTNPESKNNCNSTCKNEIKPVLEKSSNPKNISLPSHNSSCFCIECKNKLILKKLFEKEMIETKKLKLKLIKIYIDRKKKRIEKKKLVKKDIPPIFNNSDFQK
jgi:hypothetical protein